MTTTYSTATNAKRAAKSAGIPDAMIEIGKQADGRFYFVDMRVEEAEADIRLNGPDALLDEADAEAMAAAVAPKAKGKKPAKAKAAKAKAEPKPKAESKQDRLIAMLKRKEGASVTELASEFGWQLHTVRGAVAGALKRKLGIPVEAMQDKARSGVVYWVK